MNQTQLADYINQQLRSLFPDGIENKPAIQKNISIAIDRMQYSLKHVKLKGYTEFNYLHSDLYAQFIYFLANTVWTDSENRNLASKLFYLNKALHGINCMYDTKLPDIFIFIHCVGTVLGKAEYSNYFVVCQNVTVGSDKGNSPKISEGVYMGPGSSIIGKCTVAKFTHLGKNTSLIDQNTVEECVAYGSPPSLVIKKLKRNLIRDVYYFSEL